MRLSKPTRSPLPPAVHWIAPLFSLLLSAFLFFQCSGSGSNQNAATDVSTSNASDMAARLATATVRPDKYAVAPPFENTKTNVAPTLHLVQPDQSSTLTLSTGTTIEIPASVFVTTEGQPVTAPVEIRFREFHNAAQIIASGIPMKVRGEGGHEDWMQTAGMFEIEGSSQGKAVKIADGKSVTVHLASKVSGEYPVWYFDETAGNWQQQGINKPKPTPALQPLVREVAALRSATARKPIAPLAFDQSKPSLDFKLDIKEFPELRSLRNIVWQYAGNDPQLDPANNRWIRKTQWAEAKLEATEKPREYLLKLISNEDEHGDEKNYTIPVQPSLRGKDLEQAKADYEKAFVKYQENVKILENKAAILNEQAAFRRTLAVGGFGIYNYDLLLHRSDAMAVVADFDFGDLPSEVKKLVTVYLITGEGRTIVALPFYDWSNFSYLPKQDSRLVAVLPGNRIATFSQEDFNDQRDAIAAAKGGPYVFKMTVQDAPVNSEEALEQRILKPGEASANSKSLTLEKVYPNPLRDAVTVEISSPIAQSGRIQLLNAAGSAVMDEAVQMTEGDNRFNYTLPGNLVAGAYIVSASGADGRAVSKQVVKQ